MYWCMLIGFLILGLVYWKDRELLRFDFQAVKSFIAIMVFLTFFRLALFSFGIDIFGENIVYLNKGLRQVSFWKFSLVFWEDSLFAIPIYYMKDKWQWSKYLWVPIVTISSAYFGIGHMYQFDAAFFFALVVPYFLFYRYGVKYGFGTTMTCHILFDMFTFLTFKLLPIVLL